MSSNVIQLFPNGRPGDDGLMAEHYCEVLRQLTEYGIEIARMIQRRVKTRPRASADDVTEGGIPASALEALGALECISRALRLSARLTRLLGREPLPDRSALNRVLADIGRDLGIAVQFDTRPWKSRASADIQAMCARAARTSAAPRPPGRRS